MDAKEAFMKPLTPFITASLEKAKTYILDLIQIDQRLGKCDNSMLVCMYCYTSNWMSIVTYYMYVVVSYVCARTYEIHSTSTYIPYTLGKGWCFIVFQIAYYLYTYVYMLFHEFGRLKKKFIFVMWGKSIGPT